ncbi:hypothetical protein BDQ12DRAFT_729805 [Crucibulum laeve]|uniref:WD40-repeat-containing domain protein n=1 Tax=Crucibulum laeve TaxID=68775 RepID=A0A5C3LDP3_9AGAR|nr:hypothetical protein BDQ12DRAFT_729814 [Crucibulum laeve]TFK31173.1 hypothetical protein BDQ12DRAFT_729805 [Crucibulum laeve]
MSRLHPTRLESPLNLYSTSELEDWLLVRFGADVAWRRDTIRCTRKRKILAGEQLTARLIEGGRWLILGSIKGTVTAYDLESNRCLSDVNAMEGLTLVNPSSESFDSERINKMAVDIDTNAVSLTFRLALTQSMYLAGIDPPEGITRIRIWDFSLAGHGSDAQLVSQHLRSFSAYENGVIASTSLCGDLFSWSIFPNDDTKPYVEIFAWNKCTSALHMKAVVFLEQEHGVIRVEILPRNRILCFSLAHMMVYDIPKLELIPGDRPVLAYEVLQARWKMPELYSLLVL